MQPGGRPEPELAKTDPQAYFLWLRGNGLDPVSAATQVQQRFGPGKTPQQRADEQRKAEEKAGLIGGLGQIGGALGGTYLLNKALSAGTATGVTEGVTTAGGALGTAGGGLTTAGGATGAGATTAGTGGLASIGSVALPVAAAAIALQNMYETGGKDILRGKGDSADWMNQGVNAVFGGVPNIALRMLGKRSIGAMMKSGKSQAQKIRDDFRGDLKEAGVVDDNYEITLADGSKFNVGKDGGARLQNVGKNIDGKTERRAYDVDFSNPLAKFATDKIDPMIRKLYGADDPKAKYNPGQFTGMLVNAATSNAKTEEDVMKNIQAMLGKSKFAENLSLAPTPAPIQRPGKGQVARVSPGMYMNDQGRVTASRTVGEALRANYGKKKGK